jgi:2-polyprenyl-3-methyl-5-hydroxy-6-metoxy-1,4-benzoquinol methylase
MEDIRGQETLESMKDADWYNKWLLDKFKVYLKGDILEVGCGIGNFTQHLLNYGQVTAIDIREDYVKKVKELPGVLSGLGNVEKGSFFFKNKKFDVIVCINVLEHIEHDDRALSNMAKLLKPNGRLILLVPAHQSIYGEIDKAIYHFRRYGKLGIVKKLESQNLKIVQARRLNMLAAIGWFIAGRMLKNKTVQSEKIKVFNLIGPVFLFLEKYFEPPFGVSVLVVSEKKS